MRLFPVHHLSFVTVNYGARSKSCTNTRALLALSPWWQHYARRRLRLRHSAFHAELNDLRPTPTSTVRLIVLSMSDVDRRSTSELVCRGTARSADKSFQHLIQSQSHCVIRRSTLLPLRNRRKSAGSKNCHTCAVVVARGVTVNSRIVSWRITGPQANNHQ